MKGALIRSGCRVLWCHIPSHQHEATERGAGERCMQSALHPGVVAGLSEDLRSQGSVLV